MKNPPAQLSEWNFISEIKNIIFNRSPWLAVVISQPFYSIPVAEIDIYFWRLYFAQPRSSLSISSSVVGCWSKKRENPFLSLSHRPNDEQRTTSRKFLPFLIWQRKNGWSFSHSMNNKIRNFTPQLFLSLSDALDGVGVRSRWWNVLNAYDELLDGWREWTWLILVCSQQFFSLLPRYSIVVVIIDSTQFSY